MIKGFLGGLSPSKPPPPRKHRLCSYTFVNENKNKEVWRNSEDTLKQTYLRYLGVYSFLKFFLSRHFAVQTVAISHFSAPIISYHIAQNEKIGKLKCKNGNV